VPAPNGEGFCGEYARFWAQMLPQLLEEYVKTLKPVNPVVLHSAIHRIGYPLTQWGSCSCRN